MFVSTQLQTHLFKNKLNTVLFLVCIFYIISDWQVNIKSGFPYITNIELKM